MNGAAAFRSHVSQATKARSLYTCIQVQRCAWAHLGMQRYVISGGANRTHTAIVSCAGDTQLLQLLTSRASSSR
jgi:hypothetical protein